MLSIAPSAFASELFDFQRIKVEHTKGRVFAFQGTTQTPTQLSPGLELGAGILVASSAGSMAVLDIPGPQRIYLGENSRLYLRGSSAHGIWVVSLLKGKIIVRAKQGLQKRPSNIISTIRNARQGFSGSEYILEFTNQRQTLTTRASPIRQVDLPVLEKQKSKDSQSSAVAQATGEEDIEEDVEDLDVEEDIEEAPTASSLKTKSTLSRAELAPLDPKDFYALTNTSSAAQDADTAQFEKIEVIQDSTTQFEQKISARYSRFPTPRTEDLKGFDPNYYDAKYEWKYRKQSGSNGYILNGWLEYGTEDKVYSRSFKLDTSKEKTRPMLEFNEVFYTHTGENFDFTIGKKIIKNGFGIIFSPIDDVTPKDLYDPLEKRDLGNWSIQSDFYFENLTITAALIPFFAPNRQYPIPLPNSEDELTTPVQSLPSSSLSNLFVRAKTTIDGWDMLLGIYNGHSNYNTKVFEYKREIDTNPFDGVEVEEKLVDYYPKVMSLFTGFSTTVQGGVAYGDFKYQAPHKQEEDSSYYSALVGYNKKINWLSNLLSINDVNLYLEYSRTIYKDQKAIPGDAEKDAVVFRAKNSLLSQPYYDSLFILDSLSTRLFANSLTLKTIFSVNENFDLGLGGNIDFDPNEKSLSNFDIFTFLYQISLDYKIYRDLLLKTSYEVRKERKTSGSSDQSLCGLGGYDNRCDLKRLTFKLELPF